MRFAGRFARRVKAWGSANGVPVIYCKAGERKHLIAEEYLATHEVGTGVFLVLAAKAPASVWEVSRSESSGVIGNIAKKTTYVNHYSFHIMDPQWGHVTIKMSGHPPFPAQVILNGHEYVAAVGPGGGDRVHQGGQLLYWHRGSAGPGPGRRYLVAARGYRAPGPGLRPVDLHRLPVLRPGPRRAGPQRVPLRLLHLPGRIQPQPAVRAPAAQMEDLFDRILDRTRSRLDIPTLRTMFGLKNRPHHNRASGPPAQEAVIEKSQYGLTWFRVRFGLLQLKAYTKGEHVLRFEATVHNTKELRCRRGLENFPEIITRLAGMAERFATTLDCADISFLPDGTLDELPLPSRIGATRTGGIDLNKPRIRAALAAALALAAAPHGFTVAEFAARVRAMTGHDGYTIRQAAYDLRKLRGKNLVVKPGRTRRYHVPPDAARTIAALLALRDQVIAPILAGIRSPRRGRKPATLDPHRPGLRDPPHRHAGALPRPRDHARHARRRIDNILSIGEMQAPSRDR